MTALLPPLLFPGVNIPAAHKMVEKYRARLGEEKSTGEENWAEGKLARIYGFSTTSVQSLEYQRSLRVILGDITVEEEVAWRKEHYRRHHIIHNRQDVYPLLPEHLSLYRNISITMISGKKIPSVLLLDEESLVAVYSWLLTKPPGTSHQNQTMLEWRHLQDVLDNLVLWGKREDRACLIKLNIKALEAVSSHIDAYRSSIFDRTLPPTLEEARDFLYRAEALGDKALRDYLKGYLHRL